MLLVEVEIANGLAGVGRFFSLLDRFLKLLLQEVSGVFLSFYGLSEDGFPAAVLLLHGLGGCLEIIEHFGLYSGSMRDDTFRRGIDFQHRAAAGAGNVES